MVVDCGTENKDFLDSDYYLGLRQKRVRGEEYDRFIDNFMQAVVKKFVSLLTKSAFER